MTTHDEDRTEQWRRILTGADPALPHLRRWWKRLPSSPRCKVCAAPFHGPGALLTRAIMHGRSGTNPLVCNLCFTGLRDEPGGAEIDLSILFADIRGSTALAERTSAAEFRRLLQRYYGIAGKAIEANGGIVDKYLGDGVMALFIPVIAGENHAMRAVQAGEELLSSVRGSDLAEAGVRVGAGVHTGTAFVGAIGSGDELDFSALGHPVNVAARLGSVAGPDELVVSRMTWEAAGRSSADASISVRTIEIAGRASPLEVVTIGPTVPAAR
ncbi:MAG: adenylate/guanylate cyclase domain-containing protein [Chloroflexota bacterium]